MDDDLPVTVGIFEDCCLIIETHLLNCFGGEIDVNISSLLNTF